MPSRIFQTSPYQQIKPFKAAEMADVSCGDLRRMYDWKYLGETIHKRLSQLRIVRARRPIVKFSKGHKRNSHISRIC